ncbi:cadherin-20-like [Clarias gariepinus]
MRGCSPFSEDEVRTKGLMECNSWSGGLRTSNGVNKWTERSTCPATKPMKFLKPSAHFSTVIAVMSLVTLSQGDAGDEGTRVRPLRREKRGWVWNQFFVLEEYAENKPLYVGKLHSDLDKGDGSVKYILSGEGAGTTFTLDDNTGDIHAVQRLDREMKEQYVLRAQATHRLTGHALEPESRFIVKIQDINDNEPKFLDGPYQATVPEMAPVGTSVTRVTATDADDPSYGNSARVVYSVVKGQPYFSVDRHTGEVRVALPDMDREVKGQYEVIIQAKDMAGQLGGLAGMTMVNVTLSDINDNPPHFTQKLYQMSIPESAPIGSVVGHVEAQDQDLGLNAEMRYSLIDGDGRDVFEISADSTNTYGIITVKQHLDFEKKHSYTLKAEAANTHVDKRFSANGPFRDITVVQVSVEDVDEPPQFSSTLYYAEVREDAEVGTVVIAVSAQDPDVTNNSIRYMINRVSDPDQYFSVDVSSGSLTTVLPLDREEMSWHNLTVVAMETNNPLNTASVSVAIRVLDVNDNPPSIAHYYEAFLCDKARAGQLVQSLRAVDADEPIGGQRFRYTLAPKALNNPNFTLTDNHDNSARVLTRRSSWVSQSVYHLPIIVSDGGEPLQSSTHTLTIRVCECDTDGDVSSCRNADSHTLPANLSSTALTTMLTCGSVVLVMLVLMLFLSSSVKKPFPSDEEENVRENIVHYDVEGGGEEDTAAFDITKLWKTHTEPLSYAELVLNDVKPRHGDVKDVRANNLKLRQEKQPEIHSLSCYVSQTDANRYSTKANGRNVYGYMLAKLCEVDLDDEVPPYDSLQMYAYEGEGSVAESLSSLQSSDDDELDYDYLDDWGPRFHTLAELYGTSQSKV